MQKNINFWRSKLHNETSVLNSNVICFAKYRIYGSKHFIHIFSLVPIFAGLVSPPHPDFSKFKINWKNQLEPLSFTQIHLGMWNHKFDKLRMQNDHVTQSSSKMPVNILQNISNFYSSCTKTAFTFIQQHDLLSCESTNTVCNTNIAIVWWSRYTNQYSLCF